ncbi:MAG: S16 family serine protease [Candidatus Hydrothermarchaeaceae archaeon]
MWLKVLVILIVVFGALNAYQYIENTGLSREMSANQAEISGLGKVTSQLRDELSDAKTRLIELDETSKQLRADLDSRTEELREAVGDIARLEGDVDESKRLSKDLNASLLEAHGEISRLSYKRTKWTYTLGVRREGSIAIPLEIETRNGQGLLIDTEGVLLDETVQRSLKTALYVASGKGEGLGGRELILRIHNPLEETITINGASAGAAITITMIAFAQDRDLNPNVVITGTIISDGRIGPVDFIEEKAAAAKSVNATILLVPKGRGASVEGIEIVEVEDITEVMAYMLVYPTDVS